MALSGFGNSPRCRAPIPHHLEWCPFRSHNHLLVTGFFLGSHKGRFRLAVRNVFFSLKGVGAGCLGEVVESASQEVLRKCLHIALRDVAGP